ncbi:MAG: SctK family type III secretion system sorting platform protein [Methylibium sp.]|uniref:SctK family type III secretion system sorting platform protein n=1 Tax=Methylibium sp. TaxID=2067992 RepID=UPI0018144DC5|nr:SctK family type III secretion system sorting platform protein [Methylibium sp.]MBA3596408.1 SctK family type III secretion system sorting platform protein [Methylibium sp.]
MDTAAPLSKPLPLPTQAQASWAQLLLRFNLQPASYADESWLPEWAADAREPVLQELSLAMLREHGLETSCDWWLNDRAARLFLMDRPARARLALTAGIAAHRDSLRQVVRQQHLTALRGALGDALDTLWLPVAEAVEHAPVPLYLHWEPLNGVALRQRIQHDGYHQLLRLLNAQDPVQRPAALRAAFCAPKGLSLQTLPCLPRQRTERWVDAIVNDILPRWTPTWTWLF